MTEDVTGKNSLYRVGKYIGKDADGDNLYETPDAAQYIEDARLEFMANRAEEELGLTWYELVAKRFKEHTSVSFKNAWEHPGKKGVFFGKVAGVGLGVFGIADGIHNVVSGGRERVEDMFLSDQTGPNYVRAFVGAGEIVAGLGVIYYSGTNYGKLAEATFKAEQEALAKFGRG